MEEDIDEIKISNQDIRLYLGQCAISFQKFDQLVLSAGESFVEKQRAIANILAAVGVVIDDEYLSSNNKIKLIEEEAELINERTGKRERKIFYKLGITKIPDLFMYTDEESAIEIPLSSEKKLITPPENVKIHNEVIIAERDIRIYLGQCLLDFQSFDQLVLSASEEFVNKQRYIAQILVGLGIIVDKQYKSGRDKIKDVVEPIEILNERTGRKERKLCYRLGISKIKELRMFPNSKPE